MPIKTLDECKKFLEDKSIQIDITYGAIEAHFNMMCKFACVINGFGYIIFAIVYFVTKMFPWWSLLAILGVFFIEMVGTEYARTAVYKKRHLDAKTGICEYYLSNCEEYCNMADWQQRQTFRNTIAPLVGITVKEDND